MTLDEEVFNTEVVHIIKTVNFDFGVFIIRDNIQPTNSLRDSSLLQNRVRLKDKDDLEKYSRWPYLKK